MSALGLRDADAHFAFGKNWRDYASKIDERRIQSAIADLQRLSGRVSFSGLSFLDIGCGSGLHSLAALRMGASRVTGVDIDGDSVEASRETIARFAPGSDANFSVVSVFDMPAAGFSDFDIVYSWGVLHHTGDMHSAVRAAASLVQPDGVLMIALYRKTLCCGLWRRFKKWYAFAPRETQARAMSAYGWLRKASMALTGRDYRSYVDGYERNRGMAYENDVHDWLGGYPYESISPAECDALLASCGFQLERQFVQGGALALGVFGSGCDEFVFRKSAVGARVPPRDDR